MVNFFFRACVNFINLEKGTHVFGIASRAMFNKLFMSLEFVTHVRLAHIKIPAAIFCRLIVEFLKKSVFGFIWPFYIYIDRYTETVRDNSMCTSERYS